MCFIIRRWCKRKFDMNKTILHRLELQYDPVLKWEKNKKPKTKTQHFVQMTIIYIAYAGNVLLWNRRVKDGDSRYADDDAMISN